jgi:hypothetical protein
LSSDLSRYLIALAFPIIVVALQIEKMKDDFRDIDDPVPSYEESSRLPNYSTSDTKTPRRPLQTQLAEARSSRIRTVLAAYIEPLLDTQIQNCVARNTFILIPSDTLKDLPNLSTKDLAGLPESARNAIIVRLHGPDNQAAFWLQPVVVQQLSSELKCRLADAGHKLEEPLPDEQTSSPQRSNMPTPGTSSSWLRRNFGLGQQGDPTASTRHWKLGWRSEDEDGTSSRKLGLDEMRVNARIKDVSANSESELGLLLTETVKGVWLEIEVGT